MIPNGHYSGRLSKAVEKANDATRGRDGTFYSILNKNGFYDIDDENNGLTDWQRAGVPEYNRHRMSDLCSAISDMIADFMTNPEYGVIAPNLDEIVNKLDMRGSMNKAGLDVVGTTLSAIPGGQAVTAGKQAIEQVVAAIMGGNPFDPDMIPPIAIGFPGLPISISNCFKPGFFNADWTFLYEHEVMKSTKFYFSDADQTPKIGAGIPLNLGGRAKILILKLIFAVPTVNENGNPEGDMENGLTEEQFSLIMKASDMTSMSEIESDNELKEFELTDGQMRSSYFRYIQIVLWNTLCNAGSWPYLHWGCVTNNSCPEPVKTAVCSYVRTNGMALDTENSPESCLLSYLVNTGMAYKIGMSRAVAMLEIDGDKYLEGKKTVSVSIKKTDKWVPAWVTRPDGVPQDRKLADKYFCLAADLLSRMTYDGNPHASELRRRRVDEANLIYAYLGKGTIQYGKADIPREVNKTAVQGRGFFDICAGTFRVYSNNGVSLPEDPDDIKIVDESNSTVPLSDITKKTIRYIARKAGLRGVVVTSVYRDPEKQAKVMLDNRQKANGGRSVSYAAAGRSVDDKFDEVSRKHYGRVTKLKDADAIQEALNSMASRIRELAKQDKRVSKHGADPSQIQAVDMGPNRMKSTFRYSSAELVRFHNACNDTADEGYLRAYFGPEEYGKRSKDPAFHIEVWQDGNHKTVPEEGNSPMPLPDQDVQITNANLINFTTFDSVFTRDQVDAATTE